APMKDHHNTFPLFLKIWILFILLILMILAPSGILIVKRGKQVASFEMIQRGNLLARHLAASARIPLLSRDNLTLKLLVKEGGKDTDILYAFVTDAKKNVLVHTGSIDPFEVLRLSPRLAKPGSRGGISPPSEGPDVHPFLDIAAPITYHEKTIGTFHLGLSREVLEKRMKSTASLLISAFLRYSIPGIFLGLIVLFFCSRYVTGQVEALLSGINELNMNNPGFQIKRIPRGLFSELTTAFNRLSLWLEDASEKEKTIVMPPRAGGSFRQPATPSSKLLPTQITRNQITVLFAGVKGFREYADNRSPEDVLIDLNEYFALAARIAAKYDGQVDKFIGDAVSCVFPSTPLKPDHTRRAVEAAVALQAALADQSRDGNDILNKIGIGISTGVALSGPVDALSSKIHTFIGESFKTAYSLNVLAGPGEIIMSKDVFQAVEHLVTVEPIPPREMMDRTEAWENFRLEELMSEEDHEISSR
ncbi:MAG: hypothetical protein JRI80_15975, partial [Deltaproteobacteria bacterium]|nr:hypothetical protein [Deltaproteobacteria bacterium]